MVVPQAIGEPCVPDRKAEQRHRKETRFRRDLEPSQRPLENEEADCRQQQHIEASSPGRRAELEGDRKQVEGRSTRQDQRRIGSRDLGTERRQTRALRHLDRAVIESGLVSQEVSARGKHQRQTAGCHDDQSNSGLGNRAQARTFTLPEHVDLLDHGPIRGKVAPRSAFAAREER